MTKATNSTTTTTSKAVAARAGKTKAKNHAKSTTDTTIRGPQRILDLLLAIETKTNDPNVPRKMVASQAGIKPSTFNVAISVMKNKQGLIDYDKDTIRLTDKGRDRAVPREMPLTNEAAQEEIMEKNRLSGDGMPARLFRLLLDGRVQDRAAIAAAIGCANKNTFAVMLSNMKKSDLVVYDRTTIQLSDACFPYGRPSE